MEPTEGIEPATCCLQNSCSAVELRRPTGQLYSYFPRAIKLTPVRTASECEVFRDTITWVPDVESGRVRPRSCDRRVFVQEQRGCR